MSHCNRDKFNYFWICEPLARCAKRGSSLPLGTPMEIDFTSAYLHYPLPQCSKIVTPIIFSISYEFFRLPSAKVPQENQLLRTFVWKVDPEQWAISSSRTGHDTKRKNLFWLFATNGRIDAVLLFATGMEHFDERKNNPTSVISFQPNFLSKTQWFYCLYTEERSFYIWISTTLVCAWSTTAWNPSL